MNQILIVDDHAMIRRGIQSILQGQADWEVCGEASNGEDAVQLTNDLKPNIVVMDISMPGMGGLEATRAIRRISPETKVLLLTLHDSPEWVEAALNAGAHGFLMKSDAEGELLCALGALAENGIYTSPKLDRNRVDQLLVDLRMKKAKVQANAL